MNVKHSLNYNQRNELNIWVLWKKNLMHVIKFKMAFECRFFILTCVTEQDVQMNVNLDDCFEKFQFELRA